MEALSQRDLLDVNSLPGAGAVTGSRKAQWTGRLMSGLAVLFLAFDTMGMESPLFSHTLFPLYVAVLVWGGLYLRSHPVRALLSLRVRKCPPGRADL